MIADVPHTHPKHSAPKAAGLKREEIELIASHIATALDFRPGSDLEEMTERLGGRLHFISEAEWFSENSERIEVNGNADFDVYLPQSSRLSSRFALAHELGHYFLHSGMGETRIVANFTPHSESDQSPRTEWEATTFAAALLMPEPEFIKAAREASNDFELASWFRVSEVAVKKRKEVLGIRT